MSPKPGIPNYDGQFLGQSDIGLSWDWTIGLPYTHRYWYLVYNMAVGQAKGYHSETVQWLISIGNRNHFGAHHFEAYIHASVSEESCLGWICCQVMLIRSFGGLLGSLAWLWLYCHFKKQIEQPHLTHFWMLVHFTVLGFLKPYSCKYIVNMFIGSRKMTAEHLQT